MLVRHFMTREVRVLPAHTTCREAWDFFQKHGLRRAPVVQDKRIIGIITDRDLLRTLPWTPGQVDFTERQAYVDHPIQSLVAAKMISVRPGDHLETAAERMLKHRIGGLPVLEGGKLKGIITESDLFKTFVSMKANAKGVRLTFHREGGRGTSLDAPRIALATGVQMHEFIEHESPADGLLVGLRIAGDGLDQFVERMLDADYLLVDRE